MTDANTQHLEGSRVPLVSVLMPVWNGELWVREALESLESQSFRDFEIVIVDDGGRDESISIIQSMRLSHTRIVKGPKQGLAGALAVGVEQCRGKYIARLDQDDVCDPTRLLKQVSFMERHTDCVVLGSQANEIDMLGRRIGQIVVPTSDEAIRLALLIRNPMIHSSIMMRRDAVLKVGNYQKPSDSVFPEDHSLWARLSEVGMMANHREPLISYRRSMNSISQLHADLLAQASGQIASEYFERQMGGQRLSEEQRIAIARFSSGQGRVSLRTAIWLSVTLMRFRLRYGKSVSSCWPAGTTIKPVVWAIMNQSQF